MVNKYERLCHECHLEQRIFWFALVNLDIAHVAMLTSAETSAVKIAPKYKQNLPRATLAGNIFEFNIS